MQNAHRVETNKQYFNLARTICRMLLDWQGLDPACEKALMALSRMTGMEANISFNTGHMTLPWTR
jgi:hypothetical protein